MQALTKLRKNMADGLKSLSWNGGNWVDSDLPGNIYSSPVTYRTTRIPGQHFNYAALVGPLSANSAYMACLQAFWDAFTEAPLMAFVKGPDGARIPDPNHPLTTLFETLGHDDYDSTTFRDCIISDYIGRGNAYVLPTYDRLGNPVELRYVPHCNMKPVFTPLPVIGASPVLYYEYTVGNIIYQVPVDQVVNLQLGAQEENVYLGAGRGDTLIREIFADNTMGEYGAMIAKNMGILGRIFSPKDKESVRGFDPQPIVDIMAEQSRGEKRGSDVAISVPLDIFEPTSSPEKMALDKIRQYPESRIAAVMRVPGMVAGLQIGHTQKTYANYAEARSAFWEDSILPLMARLSSQLTNQLLRRSQAYKTGVWAGFDTRQVAALKADVFKQNLDARENWRFSLWDRAMALQAMGMEPKPEDEGLYYGDTTAAQPPGVQEPPGSQTERDINPTKSRPTDEDLRKVETWLDRVTREIEELDAATVARSNGRH